ncbi:response regulator [Sulfurimonas sp. MAG313]|nr:response regulator [Sulfurimonas sp. MAG313]MDF1879871.1 response regulator [Sulfurimonas sp. MAG313]
MNILIIEDDFLIKTQIEELLQELGHLVLGSFTNASDAIAFVKGNKPDFVFMDIDLQGQMDGIECAKILKMEFNIPSIFLTSHLEEQANSMGADALCFLPKPFNDELIKEAVSSAIRKLRKETVLPQKK